MGSEPVDNETGVDNLKQISLTSIVVFPLNAVCDKSKIIILNLDRSHAETKRL